MLTIIFNWLYILFTTFCLGFAFSAFLEKVMGYRMKRMDGILLSGLVISTVYAEIFSLFYRVNVEANILLVACSLIIIALFRKKMFAFLKTAYQGCSPARKVLLPLLFLVWCYFTSRGYMVLDASLYHAQSIRWIEEYGIVKGLGNLHTRYAYNSSIFSVSALYSMIFVLGRSMHAVNGWIAFVLSAGLLDLGKCFQRKKMLLSDYARVGAIYYLTTIWDEVVAPSSDYAVMCIVFYIVIIWLTQLEESEDNNIAPYCLLCVMGVYTLTLKLTAGLILILLIKPAFKLLKAKRWKDILLYLLMGLTIALPWMIRTVIISGWLFYPLPALDLFQVDWKMPTHILTVDSSYIRVWAKGANAMGINATFRQWFPNWFVNILTSTEKLLIVGDIISGIVVVIVGLKMFIKKEWEKLDTVFVLFSVLCCYLFWQFSAPLPRYGYAYILLLTVLSVGYLLRDRVMAKLAYAFFILYGVYKLFTGAVTVKERFFWNDYYVWQQEYEENDELMAYEIDGITFYYSPAGWILGYDNFPASPTLEELEVIELRGDSLKDGFRRK